MKKTIVIDSIKGGIRTARNQDLQGSYNSGSYGIIPDLTEQETIYAASTATSTDTATDSIPSWLTWNDKNTLAYGYLANGKLFSYAGNTAYWKGTETSIGTPTSGAGNGMAYYNNRIYLATPTDISYYGAMDGTPSLNNGFWVTTLGKTALTNTTYPTYDTGITYPNHAMHVHTSDNKLYICDYVNGQGKIHFIRTSKTTVEGDTNDGSTYGALDLPFGYKPFDIESFGSNLVILANRLDSSNNPVDCSLFVWNTFDSSWLIQVPLGAVLGTALANRGGEIIVFYGIYGANGTSCTVGSYRGGTSVDGFKTLSGVKPPRASAVLSDNGKIYFTSGTNVYVVGIDGYPTAVHSVMKLGASGTALITNRNDNGSGLPAVGKLLSNGTYFTAINFSSIVGLQNGSFVSETFNVGKPFRITKITFGLYSALVDNTSHYTTIRPSILWDNSLVTETLSSISGTISGEGGGEYQNGDKLIELFPKGEGKYNFNVKFDFVGDTATPIQLPVIIEIETYDK